MHKRSSGAPCPIFTVGQPSKRPRHALFTHPNNIIGQEAASAVPDATKPSWNKPAPTSYIRPTTSSSLRQYNSDTQYPTTGYPAATNNYKYKNQENRPPHVQPNQKSVAVYSREPTPVKLANTSYHHQLTDSKSVAVQDTPMRKSKKASNPTRVITTTAHGLQQWSVVLQHQHNVTFEVFGIVNSQVSIGDFDSKQFFLKTGDGVIRCCYWEMDRKLPHLVRGKLHRVMGCWDLKHQVLKCVSIRAARPDEECCMEQLIKTGNTVLREQMASLHEH